MRRFAVGNLPHEEFEAIASHLSGCAECEQALGRLPEDDDIVIQALRRPLDCDAPSDELCEQIAESVERLHGDFDADRTEIDERATARDTGEQRLRLTMAEFLQVLASSGLLSARELPDILQRWSDRDTPRDVEELAQELFRSGKLTMFQVETLLWRRRIPLVLGEYVLVDALGIGGMGQVFKALHRRMDRLVALKIMSPAIVNSQARVERFEREVRAAARLEHPHIVAAFDAGQWQGAHFLVMQYVDGEDLSMLVKSRGPLPAAEALDTIMQAAQGLSYAHSRGVIHRDIKPANLLRDAQGNIKLLDLGLARLEAADSSEPDELTAAGDALGTIDYMAPEQAQNIKLADARADIYSLGCTLHYLLTGKPPYVGGTRVERLLAHRDQPIPSLAASRTDIPPRLERVFRKMVAKRSQDRYASADALIVDLREVLATLDAAACAPRVRDVQRGQARRARSRWLVPAGGALALLLGGAALFLRTRGQELPAVSLDSPRRSGSPVSPALGASQVSAIVDLPRLAKGPPVAVAPFDAQQARAHQKAWADYLGVDVRQPTSLGPEMVVVPPGTFRMGAVPEELKFKPTDIMLNDRTYATDCQGSLPQHRVTLSNPFWLGEKEVSVGEFRRFIEGTGYKTDVARRGTPQAASDNPQDGGRARSWAAPDYPQTDDFPVAWVSWHDAVEFCNWLSMLEQRAPAYVHDSGGGWRLNPGNGYRLASEAEWEYACRAGTTTRYYWGDDPSALQRYGWCAANSSLKAHAAGSKLANAFGLFDMAGNVREWVQDYSNNFYFNASPPADPLGPLVGTSHVVRSSAYYQTPAYARSAYRNRFPPTFSSSGLGFRVARDAEMSDDAVMRHTTKPSSEKKSRIPSVGSAPMLPVQMQAIQRAWARYLGVPTSRRSAPGPEMTLIPPGEFEMGATADEVELAIRGRDPMKDKGFFDEIRSAEPQHRVVLTEPFWLASTALTVGQFREFVKATGYQTEAQRSGAGGLAFVEGKTTQRADFTWEHPGYDQTADCPVCQVSWNDAVRYCNWLSRENQLPPAYVEAGDDWESVPGEGFRLPTEAQREYACRAGTTTAFHWGDSPRDMDYYCWYGANSDGRPQPVRQKLPNALGLFDIQGNVREWVQDRFEANYFAVSPAVNPGGPDRGGSRVARGSTCNNLPVYCHSAYRNWFSRSYASAGHGFRIAQSVMKKSSEP